MSQEVLRNRMHTMRRIVASIGRCRRYAPAYFDVQVLHTPTWSPQDRIHPRDRFTWFVSARLRNGRLFCRALNVDCSKLTGRWRIRGDEIGSRRHVADLTAEFADWLESVEDELGLVAMRGLAEDIANPFFTYDPKTTPQKDQ